MAGLAVLCVAPVPLRLLHAFQAACALGTLFCILASIPLQVERLTELPRHHHALVAGIGATPWIGCLYCAKLVAEADSYGELCNTCETLLYGCATAVHGVLWFRGAIGARPIWWTVRASLGFAAAADAVAYALHVGVLSALQHPVHPFPPLCTADISLVGVQAVLFLILTIASGPRWRARLRDAWFWVPLAGMQGQGHAALNGATSRGSNTVALLGRAAAEGGGGGRSAVEPLGSGSEPDADSGSDEGQATGCDLLRAQSWSASSLSSTRDGDSFVQADGGRRAKVLRDFERARAAGLGREFLRARRRRDAEEEGSWEEEEEEEEENGSESMATRSDVARRDACSEVECSPMVYTAADYAGWGKAGPMPLPMGHHPGWGTNDVHESRESCGINCAGSNAPHSPHLHSHSPRRRAVSPAAVWRRAWCA